MVYGIVGAGDRDSLGDFEALCKVAQPLIGKYDEICSGGCPVGGDRFAEIIAYRWARTIIIYYPLQEKRCTSKRNKRIADKSHRLIAVVRHGRVGGTEETIEFFLKRLGMTESQAIEARRLFLVHPLDGPARPYVFRGIM